MDWTRPNLISEIDVEVKKKKKNRRCDFFYTQTLISFLPFRLTPSSSNHESSTSSSFGIVSHLPSGGDSSSLSSFPACLLRPWLLLFEVLSNPLWFPLACLGLLPLVTFLILRREAEQNDSTGDDGDADVPEDDEEEEEEKDVKAKALSASSPAPAQSPSSSKSLLAAVFLLYYGVFVYDLVSYGKIMDGDSGDGGSGAGGTPPDLEFTHTEVRGGGGGGGDSGDSGDSGRYLICVYVFGHWTRSAAAVARNLVVAAATRRNRRRRRRVLQV